MLNNHKNEFGKPSSISGNNMALIEGEIVKKAGRPAKQIQYRDEIINGKDCVIGTVCTNGKTLDFIIDKEDEEKVKTRSWFAVTGGSYIGCNANIDDKRRLVSLHNFVMNRIVFPGKGAKESIDHINRNGLDNRKENLRLVSQTLQNVNQKKKARTTVLPEGIESIPKHIWYVKANGHHGDRFCIELKTEKICWKTPSSKKFTIKEKLDQAIKQLEIYYEEFPYLKPSQ